MVVLYGIASVSLLVEKFSRIRSEQGRSSVIISAEDATGGGIESAVSAFVLGRLKDADLQTVSTLGGRTQLHYQFNRSKAFDWGQFKRELDSAVSPTKTELHVS